MHKKQVRKYEEIAFSFSFCLIWKKVTFRWRNLVVEIFRHYFENYFNVAECVWKSTRKPVRLHWNVDATKTSHRLVRISSRGISGQFFEQVLAITLLGYVERIFIHKNLEAGYWKYVVSKRRLYMPHSRSYSRFEDRRLKFCTHA